MKSPSKNSHNQYARETKAQCLVVVTARKRSENSPCLPELPCATPPGDSSESWVTRECDKPLSTQDICLSIIKWGIVESC